MLRKFLVVSISCFSAFSFACSSSETTVNTNAPTVNAANRVDAANMPPGITTVPMNVNSAPGVSDQANANKVNLENVPGIPDPNKKTPVPKITPPIPGIPDQETLKKQMNTPIKDANIVNNPPKNQSSANDKPAEKPRGTTRQP